MEAQDGVRPNSYGSHNIDCCIRYIKQAAQKLRDEFDSDVPKTVDELCSLPGVGPKMAFLALQIAWNLYVPLDRLNSYLLPFAIRNHGIGVDVHVHRITNRLGWHKPPTKTPEETRLNLQSWLPTELHPDINHMLVGFGQVCSYSEFTMNDTLRI